MTKVLPRRLISKKKKKKKKSPCNAGDLGDQVHSLGQEDLLEE